MDNMYSPPGDSQDPRPTRPLGYASPAGTTPASDPQGSRLWGSDPQGGGGQGGGGQGGGGRRVRWGLGIAAVALLLCGGAAAGIALSGASSPQASAAAGPTGQAAVLNTMLSSASSPVAASPARPAAIAARCGRTGARLRAGGRTQAARGVARACRQLRRSRSSLPGIHGQFTFETASGPRTLAYQRGVVESVSADAIVVRAQDGTTWAWDLVGGTVVRQNHQRVTSGALSAGEKVFAGGPVSGAARAARLIVIRPSAGQPGGNPARSAR